MSDGREALTLAELSAELGAAPARPTRSHRERAQAQRRVARKRTSPPVPDRIACGYCTRPALEDRYVCQVHADRFAAISERLRAGRAKAPKQTDNQPNEKRSRL